MCIEAAGNGLLSCRGIISRFFIEEQWLITWSSFFWGEGVGEGTDLLSIISGSNP